MVTIAIGICCEVEKRDSRSEDYYERGSSETASD